MTSTNYVTPGQQRNLRACMICSFVQTVQVRAIPPVPIFPPSAPPYSRLSNAEI